MRRLSIYENWAKDLPKKKEEMSLVKYMEYFSKRKEELGRSSSRAYTVKATINHIIRFAPRNIPIREVDKNFCLCFIKYLRNYRRKGKTLSVSTQLMYFNLFNSVLNRAVKEEIIDFNPISKIPLDEKIKSEYKICSFLTLEEINILKESDYNHPVKHAFLFCCYCGLRYSDVVNLKWKDISYINSRAFINITCKKTGTPILIPLCNNAINYLPIGNIKCPNDEIFKLQSARSSQYAMKEWIRRCGLNKRITFHTSRHTFATLLYTNGADIYTISKLLGHRSLNSTQIYASVIDKKKIEAIKLLDL
jgi:integrase